MTLHVSGRGGISLKPITVAIGCCLLVSPFAQAQENGSAVDPTRNYQEAKKGHSVKKMSAGGTLGYGPPGLYPGFQGFGLGFHLGYGYGGDALGAGAEGGYPFYGGPGYPHPAPRLRRIGGINPFCYLGGPGYPTPDHPNFFGGFGPLVGDDPVVRVQMTGGAAAYSGDYGTFTGAVPDAETRFAPFTAQAAAGASSMRVRPAPVAPLPAPSLPAAGPQ
jgi:hypothetical protein